jgi:hypothetical protein
MADRLHSLRSHRAASTNPAASASSASSAASASSVDSTTSSVIFAPKLPLGSHVFQKIAYGLHGRDLQDRDSDASDNDSNDESVASDNLPNMNGRTPQTWVDYDMAMLERSDVDLSASKKAWHDIWKKQSHYGLALAVMKHEINERYQGSATVNSSDTYWVAKIMALILQSSENCVIETVTFGNLALDRRRDPTLAAYLKRLWRKAQYMPSIHHQ